MSVVELLGVIKHYHSGGAEIAAIDGVELTLAEGEMLAVHGPSGSGKTTLLLLTAGLLTPDRGQVRYRGRSLAELSEAQISDYLLKEVGFVYQTPRLMPRVNVLENAAIKLVLAGEGMRKAKARALPWLERLGLAERAGHTSEQLSGGERQRVAIARALACEPRLILADEPTGNLDSQRSRETVALLGEVARDHGAGVLLVTHDTDAASLADRACTLRDGTLVGGEHDGRRTGPASTPVR